MLAHVFERRVHLHSSPRARHADHGIDCQGNPLGKKLNVIESRRQCHAFAGFDTSRNS